MQNLIVSLAEHEDLTIGQRPSVRLFRVLLSAPSGSTQEYWVASSSHVDEPFTKALKERAGSRSVYLIVEERPGFALVVLISGNANAQQASAAVAAVKTIAGWDESIPIEVKIGQSTTSVTLAFSDGHWLASTSSKFTAA